MPINFNGYDVDKTRFVDSIGWYAYCFKPKSRGAHQMSLMAPAILDMTVEARLLAELAKRPLRPTDLVRALRNDVLPSEVEGVLSDLLDRGTVTFGSDRLLRAA
jgi:hypothetical protein